MRNIKLTVLEESTQKLRYYALVEVELEGKEGYCLILNDDELVIEGVGNNKAKAGEIYSLVRNGEVTSTHLSDVVRDCRCEFFV